MALAFGKVIATSDDGFTLHAARTVAQDGREWLERLCRCGLRAPFHGVFANRSRFRPRLPPPPPPLAAPSQQPTDPTAAQAPANLSAQDGVPLAPTIRPRRLSPA